MFAESTIFIANGAFKIVKRMDQNVPSYYVGCPVHAYHGGGRRHPCVKAMSITQPDEETVLLRLRKWILEGWFVEVLKYDSKKTKHIIEYFVYCYCQPLFSNEWKLVMGLAKTLDARHRTLLCSCIVAHTWICLNLAGLQMERLDEESDEDFRRRHVRYVSWHFFNNVVALSCCCCCVSIAVM